METSTKNKWLEQVNQLFEIGNYLRALEVIGEAMREFPEDPELEQLETLAWGGLGKSPEVGRQFSQAEREELDGARELSLGTKTLLGRIEGRRRDRIVEACLCQARWLKSQNDVAGALRAVESGLHRFPHEARLVELRDSLYVASELVKPRDPEPVEAASPEANVPEDVAAQSDECQKPAIPVAEAVESLPPKPAPVVSPPEPPKPARSIGMTHPQFWAGVGTAVAILAIIGTLRLIVAPKAPTVAASPTPQQALLEITTSPAGAVVLVDGRETDKAALLLGVPFAAGPVPIEARLPGYQTARTTANLRAGVRNSVSLTLPPILEFQLLLPGNGEISVNSEAPVKVEGGTFSRELTPGTYSVNITTAENGLLSFAFPVDSGGPVVLTSLPNARDVSAVLISNFGEQGRIYATGPPVKIKLDGQALGELSQAGLDLPKVTAGSHELELGEDQALRKISADFGTSRTLTAIINSDPHTGTLVVQANQNGAAITVFDGKREVAHGQITNGRFRLPNLRAQLYVVRAAKDGYSVDPSERSADIQNGQDKIVAFAFRKKLQTGSVSIRVTQGSELFVDGNAIPARVGETYTMTDLKPGTHTFRAQKGTQFLPNQKTIEVAAGQSSEVDLRLAAASIPVEIKRAPADSSVTYTRAGDPAVHTFSGNRQALSEGDYTFTARAQGYLEKVQSIHVSSDFVGPLDLAQSVGLAEWAKGDWTLSRGWYSRKGGGFIYFPQPLGTGSVEFSLHWQNKGRAQWILSASDGSYLQCELDDEGFQVFRVAAGKTPVPIGKKKPVAKMASYTIRIEVKPDSVTHKLQKDGAWVTLDSLQDTAPPAGRFGFNIPNRQELFLANLIFQPDR